MGVYDPEVSGFVASIWRVGSGPAGLLFDELLGEPPDHLHPVALLGCGLTRLEQRTYRDDRSAGVVHLVLAVVPVAVGARLAERVIGRHTATAVSVGLASAGSMLGEVAMTVAERLEAGDLEGARREVRSLVGRDPTNLDEGEIVRAVVESVAENTVDAVTATVFWAAVGGSAGVWAHRTVNTLDAMVGHRSDRYRRFGWLSARLDDAMNWLPARLTAAAVAVAVPSRAEAVIQAVVRDGNRHPSPNGGVVEAAFAGALDITLGGTNDYGGTVEVRGPLGDGPPPSVSNIAQAVSIARRVAWVSAACSILGKLIIRSVRSPRRSSSSIVQHR